MDVTKVTVVIPARNEPYLHRTIEDVLDNAVTDIEVIVVLDGWKPSLPLEDDDRLRVVYNESPKGLRAAANLASVIGNGEFLMKLDAHCSVPKGYDADLAEHCVYENLYIPSRWSLLPDSWTKGYGPIEYLYLTYPYVSDSMYGEGLHGKKWVGPEGLSPDMKPASYYYRERERANIKIDDVQSLQGSCWFCNRERFRELGGFDMRFGKTIYQEASEIGFKFFLSGGRILVNKYTWYAHLHKTTPSEYGFTRREKHSLERYATWYWMNDQWDSPKRSRGIEDFIKFHWPMPGWPEHWREQKEDFEKRHPEYSKPPER